MTRIENAISASNLFPSEIHIPDKKKIETLTKDDVVKLMFCDDDNQVCTKIWVKIAKKSGKFFVGYVQNDSMHINDIHLNDSVNFKEEHIIDIWSNGFLMEEPSNWFGNE